MNSLSRAKLDSKVGETSASVPVISPSQDKRSTTGISSHRMMYDLIMYYMNRPSSLTYSHSVEVIRTKEILGMPMTPWELHFKHNN